MTEQTLLQTLEHIVNMCLVPPTRELTLNEAHFLTGISPTMLRRRWKYDPDWCDVIYAVGVAKKDFRTTLELIRQCQLRASERASKEQSRI